MITSDDDDDVVVVLQAVMEAADKLRKDAGDSYIGLRHLITAAASTDAKVAKALRDNGLSLSVLRRSIQVSS